jgi:rubrerythrin
MSMQITAKDLSYLSDEMSWELIAMKKYHHYAQEVQDPELQAAINKIGAMHQNHYQALLQHLQSANGQSQSNTYMQ